MKCLAIDASTDHLSLAVTDGQSRFVHHEKVGQKHAELTLPHVGMLLAQAGMTLGELDAIAFGQGPGAFTGLRIACGIAQGLAFSHDLPLIGIPTLDCVAAQCPEGRIWVCTDARMGQIYMAAYDTAGTGRLGPIVLTDPDAALPPDEASWTGAGDAFGLYPALGERLHGGTMLAQCMPHAGALLDLAASGRYPACKAEEADLLYIRDKVALTAQEQKAARA